MKSKIDLINKGIDGLNSDFEIFGDSNSDLNNDLQKVINLLIEIKYL